MHKVVHQKFSVSFDYPVVFTRDAFSAGNTSLKQILKPHIEHHPAPVMLVYMDEGVAASHSGLADRIDHYMQEQLPGLRLASPPVLIQGGERLKSGRETVKLLLRQMADARLDRHSYVMAIGGGAVLDAVGYAASLVHRGVRMIRLPTTVLAQNDAGVGVKTAVNDPAGKNFFGTFAPPFAVVNDLDFLNSLPDEDWRNGIAEAFKVALIKDETFFNWLCKNAPLLANRNEDAMEHLVVRCAELHLEHIRGSGDPFEMGEARPLDFGHWSAHQLEAATGYQVTHGRAVAIGIMLDALYAMSTGGLDRSAVDALYHGLKKSGFQLWHDLLEQQDASGRFVILEGLERFREHLGGKLCITMPTVTGSSREISSMDESLVIRAIKELKNRNAAVYHQHL